jgi:hypothetical protein
MNTTTACERMGNLRGAFQLGRDTGKGNLPGTQVGGNTIHHTKGPLCDQTEPNDEGFGLARVSYNGEMVSVTYVWCGGGKKRSRASERTEGNASAVARGRKGWPRATRPARLKRFSR